MTDPIQPSVQVSKGAHSYRVQHNDIGVEIRIRVITYDGEIVDLTQAVTLGNAATRDIVIRRPSGEVFRRSAHFTEENGADGIMRYISQAGDFKEVGSHDIQARVEWDNSKYRTELGNFIVLPNLELT